VRQSYLQKLLKQALVAVGHPAEAERLTHFSYEMVALSHATARELGYAAATEEAGKPVRRGLRPQGARRQGRRPARSRHREGAAEVAAQPELPDADRRASPRRSASPPCATS
jgi:hypothetical protein